MQITYSSEVEFTSNNSDSLIDVNTEICKDIEDIGELAENTSFNYNIIEGASISTDSDGNITFEIENNNISISVNAEKLLAGKVDMTYSTTNEVSDCASLTNSLNVQYESDDMSKTISMIQTAIEVGTEAELETAANWIKENGKDVLMDTAVAGIIIGAVVIAAGSGGTAAGASVAVASTLIGLIVGSDSDNSQDSNVYY